MCENAPPPLNGYLKCQPIEAQSKKEKQMFPMVRFVVRGEDDLFTRQLTPIEIPGFGQQKRPPEGAAAVVVDGSVS